MKYMSDKQKHFKFEWRINETHIIGIYVYETRRKLKKKYYTKETLLLITLGRII